MLTDGRTAANANRSLVGLLCILGLVPTRHPGLVMHLGFVGYG
jgi:hypothetical protein